MLDQDPDPDLLVKILNADPAKRSGSATPNQSTVSNGS